MLQHQVAVYQQYFFECPPVNAANLDTKPFEFILMKAHHLERPPTRNTYQDYFTRNCLSVKFLSRGKDTQLISPCPPANPSDDQGYVHLASFMMNAPDDKIKDIWKRVAISMLDRIKQERPNHVWLSTAGGAVAWLHIRLDPRPIMTCIYFFFSFPCFM